MIQIIKDRTNHTRRYILGAQTVSAAVNFRCILFAVKHGLNILIQRFADGTRFLGSVQHCNSLNSLWQNIHKIFLYERTVKSNLNQTNLVTVRKKFFHGFFDGFADRSHRHDYVLCVRRTDIVKRLVLATGYLADLIHVFYYDFRQLIIELVGSFSCLKEDIRILCSTANHRMFRVERSLSKLIDCV